MRTVTISRNLVILAALSIVPAGLAQATAGEEEPPGTERVRAVAVPDASLDTSAEKLRRTIDEANFEEAELDQVMDWLAEVSQLNLVVRWQVLEDAGVERDKPITMSLRNLKLYQVLWMVLDEAGRPDLKLAWETLGEELVVVSTAEDLARELILRFYEVRPLLAGSIAWRNSQAELKAHQPKARGEHEQLHGIGQPASTATAEETPTAHPVPGTQHSAGGAAYAGKHDHSPEEELCELLVYCVRPDAWAQNGGPGTAQCFNGMLVVRQSRSVHRELAALLNALLEAGAAEAEPH